MLGRLQMTVDECIDVYTDICDKVFKVPSRKLKDIVRFKSSDLPREYDSKALDLAVVNVLKLCGMHENAPLGEYNAPKALVYTQSTV
jgi:hypothetical protein